MRQCALTREKLPQAEMIRFVRGPAGELVPDIAGKLPGRGVWLRADRESVDQAVAKGVFPRALKGPVEVPDGLSDQVEARLLEHCIGLLGLARKSGQVVIGHDQVRAALHKGPPGWLLEASDGSADGRAKVQNLARALYGTVNVAGALASAELGMAFGRPRVIHACLKPGPLAESWAAVYRRLVGFRPAPEDHWFRTSDR